MTTASTAVLADAAPSPKGPYNHAIAAGNLLFVGCQIGSNPITDELSDSVSEQTTQTLRNLDAICQAAGASLLDATRMTLYLVDLADLAAINEAYAAFFGERLPARSTLQAAALVGGARICIDAIVTI